MQATVGVCIRPAVCDPAAVGSCMHTVLPSQHGRSSAPYLYDASQTLCLSVWVCAACVIRRRGYSMVQAAVGAPIRPAVRDPAVGSSLRAVLVSHHGRGSGAYVYDASQTLCLSVWDSATCVTRVHDCGLGQASVGVSLRPATLNPAAVGSSMRRGSSTRSSAPGSRQHRRLNVEKEVRQGLMRVTSSRVVPFMHVHAHTSLSTSGDAQWCWSGRAMVGMLGTIVPDSPLWVLDRRLFHRGCRGRVCCPWCAATTSQPPVNGKTPVCPQPDGSGACSACTSCCCALSPWDWAGACWCAGGWRSGASSV